MKKIYIVFAIAMLIGVTGCKDANAGISSDEALITVDNSKITKKEIFQLAKQTDGGAVLLQLVQEKIAEKEGITKTEEMKKSANEALDSLKKMYGDKLDETLKQNGYTNAEDYLDKTVYPNLRLTELTKKYIKENQSTLFTSYFPVKAQILEADTEEKAKSALEALKKGDKFEDVVKKYGITTTFKGADEIYTSKSGIPSIVFDKIKAINKKGLIEEVIHDAEAKKYYLVNLTNVDPKSFEDEAIKNIAEKSGQELQPTAITSFLKKYDFKVYDKSILDAVQKAYPDFKN